MFQNILRKAVKDHQMMMAENIKHLSTKEAKKHRSGRRIYCVGRFCRPFVERKNA